MDRVPTCLWLTDVRYLEGKRAIAAEFSRLNLRRMVRLPFFPSFYISKKNLGLETLNKVFAGLGKKTRLADEGSAFKLTASTFSNLNSAADLLFRETGFRALVLRPERQFLLQKQWSYFDCFTFFSEQEFSKNQEFSVPKARLGFFSEPIHETLTQLAEESLDLAENLAGSIALSNLLRMPIASLPCKSFLQQEAMLENIFWKTGLGLAKGLFDSSASQPKQSSIGFKGLAEVDFSLLWPMLLTKPIYNLGPDTLDCSCCKPQSLSEKNVLPNSLVLVEFLQDGFFFESGSKAFAQHFHQSNSGKESRLRRKQEFCLNSLPLGPFFRHQKVLIPFADALRLGNEAKVRIVKAGKMHWFCLEYESVISKAVSGLNRSISLLESRAERMRSHALREQGILGQAFLSSRPDYLLLKKRFELATGLLCSVPGHLCNPKSAFFKKSLCSAIEAIESTVLESFSSFVKGKENRVVSVARGKAYVKSNRPYSLIRQFSETRKIPALLRAKTV